MSSLFNEVLQLRFYRGLIRLYPASFREQFGDEQLIVIRDMLREEKQIAAEKQGTVTRTILIDLIGSILHENIFQWRHEMKTAKVIQAVGTLALLAWALFFSFSLTRSLLGFPEKDPTTLLLGESYSSLASTLLDLAVYLIPFITFLVFLIPAVKVQSGASTGETMVIRLQKMEKVQVAFALISLILTVVLWGLILLSHFGLV